MTDIKQLVETGFSSVYTHFKEFQQDEIYKSYWDKCIEAVSDKELLSHIIFCNDLFGIPPVKTFLTYYKDDFIKPTGSEKAELPLFVKKSIGAFGVWFSRWYSVTRRRKAYLYPCMIILS